MKEQDTYQEQLPFYELDYSKLNGLVPATILDSKTGLYLMTGFMTEEAYRETLKRRKVTFFKRTERRLWMKGEKSGNVLNVKSIVKGCESDIVAIYADPKGPVCHRNTWTCFDDESLTNLSRQERFRENAVCPLCGR